MQSCHVCHSSLLANEEESIYGHSIHLLATRPNWSQANQRPRVALSEGRENPLMSIIRELKRRNVFRMAISYLVTKGSLD